jgi:class 3 adenylate cyclase/tetratricopeptide (TPR) repeat protein
MLCPECQFENPEDSNFCFECGQKLEQKCPQCEKALPVGVKFCNECGHKLTAKSTPSQKEFSFDEKLNKIQRYLPKGLPEKILAQKDRIEGERKQITVMFCDMEGFTALSEKLGIEEAYSVMDQIYEILIHKVHDYEGTVNEMTGDGIMALFGAPIALEDAIQRAIRSALAIHREMTKFSDKNKQDHLNIPPIKMRIGIHTGPVVVGTLGNDLRVEFKAVGDTVNLASRVEGLAESGTTYVTEDTFKLSEGFFRFESLGEKDIKGKEKPIRVYRVIAPSTSRTRFDVSAERGLTAFVGRERELELMLDGFERAKSGRGQAFSIMGEAGVGKSRLLYEFRKAVANEDVTFLEGKCLSYSRGVAYHPVIDILKSNFDIREEDKDSEIREKVSRGLKVLNADETSTLPYLLELLSVADSGIDKISMGAEVRKDCIIEAVRRIALKGSETRLLIMAFEDLHWIDKSSEDSLRDLLENISGTRVFLIFTYRPEFVHTWGGKSYHNQVTLNRLSNRESLAMVTYLLSTEDIDKGLKELVLEKTEGIPFFIEEFIKTLLEQKVIEKRRGRYRLVKDTAGMIVPSTVQDVLMARIDSLAEGVKGVLQTGSVVGREFNQDLIQVVTGLSERELLSDLSVLKDSEFLYERGIYPQSNYIFKHALTQEVAYNSLLHKRRKEIHEKIGNAIEQIYTERLEEFFEMLAYHFEQGEVWEKALEYTLEAAERARKLYARPEAVTHYWQALELLEHIPRTGERGRTHIDVVLSLVRLPGWRRDAAGQTEVFRHVDEAMRVADDIGDAGCLARLESFKGYSSQDQGLLTRAIARAETSGDAFARAYTASLYAHYLGETGQYEKTLPHIDQAIKILGTEGARYEQALTMAVGGRCYCTRAGKLEEALSYAARAREIGEAMGDARLRAWGAMEAEPYMYKGLWEQVVRVAEEGLPAAWEIGELTVISFSSSWLGIAYLKLGRLEDAKRVLGRALKESQARTVAPFTKIYLQIAVAHLHLALGEPGEALGAARKALQVDERSSFPLEQGAAYRILGQVHEAMGSREEAEAAFRRSLQVLEEIQSRPEQAQTLLAYGRFKTGRDDPAGGRTLIESALRLFEEMGATGWIDEARAAL